VPARASEPQPGSERDILLGWLAFHRDTLAAKCADVSADALVRTGLGGSTLSLLGLVRHLTEMERVYATYSLGGADELVFVYGPYDDGGPEGDFDGLTPDMVDASMAAWHAERDRADASIAALPSLDHARPGSPRTARWCLVKLVQEYARHNGHADLIRQSIDGTTGE
jgi:Protein of unknown function (DUF664)